MYLNLTSFVLRLVVSYDIVIAIYKLRNIMWINHEQLILAYLQLISHHNIDLGLIMFPFISVCLNSKMASSLSPLDVVTIVMGNLWLA